MRKSAIKYQMNKDRIGKQKDESDCGAACICALAASYGLCYGGVRISEFSSTHYAGEGDERANAGLRELRDVANEGEMYGLSLGIFRSVLPILVRALSRAIQNDDFLT